MFNSEEDLKNITINDAEEIQINDIETVPLPTTQLSNTFKYQTGTIKLIDNDENEKEITTEILTGSQMINFQSNLLHLMDVNLLMFDL